ncbi:antitoxin of toxin-antitoxin stability system [Leuconostoc pseudomesenteroides]|jgi:antitoxin component of MazEF toxin-antitoxin module|uniref:Antitoxin of toxin-antitoxin stability system n=1 Tax=Leuconostoc pseudomesenteroides TaxID=33968 RepID=A0A5B8T5F6_LEUPS|nr:MULTISPECIES: antitoxin of toxin-antitoxin stability system [Leuconostoc]MBK0040760.1 antitoxin of toxin-antitoxin stability system [Leuconostoc sp. S51]MBK0051818.1 antitoxin of toxin-antitoxin stability system [Leuconostoc sp. S50]MCT4380338.1 antitoxin of toxin-antitoxin stability system [Leuconostoc pseudomesenteroides]QEA42350.1 antitoxin of toxin-antitoxin stability system [Leuconostoc pseudomesenteroides]
MPIIKIRKVGTSEVLTVPKTIQHTTTEFEVFSGRNGSIVYTPKRANPFHDEKFIKEHATELAETLNNGDLLNDEF